MKQTDFFYPGRLFNRWRIVCTYHNGILLLHSANTTNK